MIRFVVLIVLLAGSAHAERLADPEIVHRCPSGTSWHAVETCLGKIGTVRIVQTLDAAKVVGVRVEGAKRPYVEHGLILYVQRKGIWTLEGMFLPYGSDFELLKLQAVAIGRRPGHRLDIGKVIEIEVESRPATLRMQQSLFCTGQNWLCTEVTTSCEVLVRGKTRWAFRGTLTVDRRWVVVTGDRRKAGPLCAVPERVAVNWMDP